MMQPEEVRRKIEFIKGVSKRMEEHRTQERDSLYVAMFYMLHLLPFRVLEPLRLLFLCSLFFGSMYKLKKRWN